MLLSIVWWLGIGNYFKQRLPNAEIINYSLLNMKEIIELLREQNKILNKNTAYTGGGFLVGAVALIIALIALVK